MAARFRTFSCKAMEIAPFFQHGAKKMLSARLLMFRKYASGIDKAARRKELMKEFKKGYFADIKEFQKTGGKRFMAPNELIPKEKAIKFPPFVASSLSGNKVDLGHIFQGHATLMLIAMRGVAQPMCDAYREPFCQEFKDFKTAQYFEVNAVDSLFYGIFKGFINRTLRNQIPADRHGNYLCYYGSTKGICSDGLVENIIVGHAFLVDRKGLALSSLAFTFGEQDGGKE
eukprot:gene15197-16766_t